MLKYLSDDVNPIVRDLVQRIIVKRPRDVLGYAIKDLIEQQRLIYEATSRSKNTPTLKPINVNVNLANPASSAGLLPSIGVLKEKDTVPAEDHMFSDIEDPKQRQPTFNGEPLTLDFAHAEIMRLREAIKTVSENISAEKSRLELAAADDIRRSYSLEANVRKLEFLHFSDVVGFGAVHDDLLSNNMAARFLSTLKELDNSNSPMLLFGGNFLGGATNCSTAHFSEMIKLMNTMGECMK
jgi:hypothetical protein